MDQESILEVLQNLDKMPVMDDIGYPVQTGDREIGVLTHDLQALYTKANAETGAVYKEEKAILLAGERCHDDLSRNEHLKRFQKFKRQLKFVDVLVNVFWLEVARRYELQDLERYFLCSGWKLVGRKEQVVASSVCCDPACKDCNPEITVVTPPSGRIASC